VFALLIRPVTVRYFFFPAFFAGLAGFGFDLAFLPDLQPHV